MLVRRPILGLKAHAQHAARTLNLILLRDCTPLVTSVRMSGLLPPGPKHQILRAEVTTLSDESAK